MAHTLARKHTHRSSHIHEWVIKCWRHRTHRTDRWINVSYSFQLAFRPIHVISIPSQNIYRRRQIVLWQRCEQKTWHDFFFSSLSCRTLQLDYKYIMISFHSNEWIFRNQNQFFHSFIFCRRASFFVFSSSFHFCFSSSFKCPIARHFHISLLIWFHEESIISRRLLTNEETKKILEELRQWGEGEKRREWRTT